MPGHPFQYAIVRVVPRVERGEALNAGVILSAGRSGSSPRGPASTSNGCGRSPRRSTRRPSRLTCRVERIAAGDPTAGPIAALGQGERFHWLVAPSSTVIQPSEVHTGICDDPAEELDHLFERLVR